MKIEIPYKDKKFYIESAPNSFNVCDGYREIIYKGKPSFEPIDVSYHATIEQALNEILNRCCKNSKANTITELLNDIRDIRKLITQEYTVGNLKPPAVPRKKQKSKLV
jgi:hypothetical protein